MVAKTVVEHDRTTDRIVALFALLAAVAGAMAEAWPLAAGALIVALAVGLVIVIAGRREPVPAEDYCDSDCHLADVADVANGEGERA